MIKNIIKESWSIFKTNWWKIYLIFVVGFVINMVGEFADYKPAAEYTVSQKTAEQFRNGDISRDQLALRAEFFDAEAASTVLTQYFETISAETDNLLDVDFNELIAEYSFENVAVEKEGNLPLSALLLTISVLLGLIYGVYVTLVYLGMVRKEEKVFRAALAKMSAQVVIKYILTTIAIGLIMLLIGLGFAASFFILGTGVQHAWAITLVTSLILLVIFVRAVLAFYFAPLLSIDKNMWPKEALLESKKITKGNILQLIGLFSAMTLVVVAGALALLVGLLVAVPVVVMMFYTYYEKLVNDKIGAKSTEAKEA